MATPEPRPTLLASIGVSGGEAPPTPRVEPDDEPATTAPSPQARRRAPRTRSSPRSGDAPNDRDPSEGAEALPLALDRIRQRHRQRRSSGSRTPLAPLNVDLPLELLEHVRQVSQDIPYPLRRLAEEAIELWLEATGNRPSPEGPAAGSSAGE